MKTLLVYPTYPDTFWSFKHALRFISKKALHPPLRLMTVAAILPDEWEKKLVDMNVETLIPPQSSKDRSNSSKKAGLSPLWLGC